MRLKYRKKFVKTAIEILEVLRTGINRTVACVIHHHPKKLPEEDQDLGQRTSIGRTGSDGVVTHRVVIVIRKWL